MKSKRKTAAAPADVDFGDDALSELRAAYDFYGAQNDALKKDDLRSIMGKLSTSLDLQEVAVLDHCVHENVLLQKCLENRAASPANAALGLLSL